MPEERKGRSKDDLYVFNIGQLREAGYSMQACGEGKLNYRLVRVGFCRSTSPHFSSWKAARELAWFQRHEIVSNPTTSLSLPTLILHFKRHCYLRIPSTAVLFSKVHSRHGKYKLDLSTRYHGNDTTLPSQRLTLCCKVTGIHRDELALAIGTCDK